MTRPDLARLFAVITLLGTGLGWTGAAGAQVLPGSLPPVGVPNLPIDRTIDAVDQTTSALERRAGQVQSQLLTAPASLRNLVRRSRGALVADPQGYPAVAGEIVVLDPSPQSLARAEAESYVVLRRERLDGLDIETVVLAPPSRQPLMRAVERLRRLAPEAEITFNHVHAPAGRAVEALNTALPSPLTMAQRRVASLGLIDTGVDARHPAFAGANIVQRGFAGTARPADHGTAVASLMMGQAGAFRGAAPGADLRVADVYGGAATGGSSTALAQALAWLVRDGARVINVSLVGPRNPLVERAVTQARARGIQIVAAVGNDGPAAPPLYPAAYPGVIAVAPVDRRDRILPEAGRGPHVDFAAPGSDMAAAATNGRWVTVRGASFAAPLVAGLLARGASPETLGRQARDLGAPGADPIYGRGLVGSELRVAPTTMGARGRLSR